jgi:hypothetical protein
VIRSIPKTNAIKTGINLEGRPTKWPSFAELDPNVGIPQKQISTYGGADPYIITTNRDFKPSVSGRHSKGKTMFPVDESGNYVTSFPISETRMFKGKPHWLKGYQEISQTPKQTIKEYALQKAEPYLMGDKKIPMVGYKPKSNVVGYENPNFPRDFEADDYASFIIDDAGKVQHPSNTRTNQAPQANPINHPIIKNPLPTDKLETWARNYRNNMSPEDINNALVKTYGDKYSYANIERLLNNNQIDENLAYNMLHNSMRKYSNNFKGWITEEQYDLLPKNKSGFTKHAIEKILGNKKLKESIDFEKTLLKPNNKLITHQENTPINSTEMPMETYLDIFNKNLPKLNKIIEKNNKSGIPYTVERLENGTLHFKSELGNTYFGVGVRPGKFKGKVLDVGDERYYQNLPGLNMTNTTNSVFADRIPRSGSAAYKSINEYLKLLKLGRVKPGFNSQTTYSKGLWNDAMLKNKAVGFFKDPNTLVGSMKLIAPIVGGGSLLYNQPNLKNKEDY